MSDRVASSLHDVFRSLVVRSPMEYELGGANFRVSAFAPPAFDPHAGHAHAHGPSFASPPTTPLVNDLQQRLYEYAYVRALNGRIQETPPPTVAPQSLADELTAANATRERWEGGWQIVQFAPNGAISARKGSILQMIPPGRYAMPQGGSPFPGAWVNIHLAKESRDLQPGFYHVFGEVPLEDGSQRLTRIYFNIDEGGAAPLVHAITSSLNRLLVPFRMKTLSYRGAYTRSDAAVLFFTKRHYGIVSRLLSRIRGAVRDHLRPRTPLLTKHLGDGVGLAEDPGSGIDSFGTHRCRLIAQAVWDAYTRGEQSEESRLEELDLQFSRNGLVLARPWLRPSSADVYELPEDA